MTLAPPATLVPKRLVLYDVAAGACMRVGMYLVGGTNVDSSLPGTNVGTMLRFNDASLAVPSSRQHGALVQSESPLQRTFRVRALLRVAVRLDASHHRDAEGVCQLMQGCIGLGDYLFN